MALMNSPPWSFADYTSNLTGTPPAATVGTNFTAGANNTDGSAVSVLSALGHDVHYLVVGIGGISASAANHNALMDVLADPAGGTSWGSFIDDLMAGFTPIPTAGTIGIQSWYHFPIYIPAGTSLGVQARSANATAATAGRVVMYAYGNPSRPEMWWCGSKVESLGVNASSSLGTAVTAGNSGSWGSWTNIGTSGYEYGAVQFGLNGTDGASAAVGYYWQIGYGSNQLPGSPDFYASVSTAESAARTGFCQPIFCNAPASTTWQTRGKCSGTSEPSANMGIYGVY